MRFVVDIHLGSDGRPTGTVRTADQADPQPFSGNLEFLAVIERLCGSEPDRHQDHQPSEES